MTAAGRQPAAGRPPGRLARLLLPSPSDLVFLYVFCLVLTALPTWLFGDGDTGFHVRTGEIILDTLSIPRTDPFSFTRAGAPWVAWEWLSDVALGAAHRAAGLNGILVLSATLLALTMAVGYRQTSNACGRPLVALVVIVLAAFSSLQHWLARPHLVTLLFAALSFALLEGHRRRGGRRVYWLLPLTMLWANLHGGFLVAPLMAALYAVGALLEASLDETGPAVLRRRAASFAAVVAGSTGLSLVNPLGAGLHAHILDYLFEPWHHQTIIEFLSPDFHDPFLLPFELVVLAFVVVGLGWGRRLAPTHLLVLLVWLHLALYSVRHIPIFLVFAPPILATLWGRAGKNVGSDRAGRSRVLAALARVSARVETVLCQGEASFRAHLWPAFAVVAAAWLAIHGGMVLGQPLLAARFPDAFFPVAALDQVESRLAGHRVYGLYRWGGYLIYRSFPRMQVFVDGRSDFYGPEFLRRNQTLEDGGETWRRELDRWRVEFVLTRSGLALATLLDRDRDWRRIYRDATAAVYERRDNADAARGPR